MPVRTYTPHLGGRFVPLGRRALEEVTAPFDGRRLARIAVGTSGDLDQAIAYAREGAARLQALSRRQRADFLARAAEALRRRQHEFAALIAADAGKPVTLAEAEVSRCITVLRLSAEEAPRFGVTAVSGDPDSRGAGRLGLVERVPVGLVAAISPFNFPLNLVAHKVAPALATGNAVVLKPPPQAPLAAFHLTELLTECGAPPGALQVLHLPIPIAERLARDEAFALLSFTGSAKVGWHLKSVAGRKRVVLELGGNAATIVHSDVEDLPEVAARIAWGAFAYAGQVCIKVQRLLVHRPIYRRFVNRVMEAARALKNGDPGDSATVIGPMIDDGAVDRVTTWVREAVAGGATPLLQGRRRGRLLGPTILEGARRDMKVVAEEVFGPVLTVAPYGTWREALALANASRYGLQAGVYTNDQRRIFDAFRTLEVGGVIINDLPTFRLDHLPYGGVKASGFGREGIRSAMETMTEERVMILRA